MCSVSLMWGSELVIGTMWVGECGAGNGTVCELCRCGGGECLEVRSLDKVWREVTFCKADWAGVVCVWRGAGSLEGFYLL